jgi:hypothetical protein
MLALQRAKDVTGNGGTGAGTGQRPGAGGTPGPASAPGGTPPGGTPPGGTPPGGMSMAQNLGQNFLGALGNAASLLPASSLSPTGPRITVLAGTRVFDAYMTKWMNVDLIIDDATERQVPQSMQNQYYDDGTHGDLEANDGKFSNVTTNNSDYISQSNQRIKERLIHVLVGANTLNTIDFFGLAIMSSDRTGNVSRDRAWKVVASPNGVSSMLKEVMIDHPVEVPNDRERTTYKDKLVGAQWSDSFLRVFRKKEDDMRSEFYSVYVPMPPTPPSVSPPAGWSPFAATTPAEMVQTQESMDVQPAGGGAPVQPMRPMGGAQQAGPHYGSAERLP